MTKATNHTKAAPYVIKTMLFVSIITIISLTILTESKPRHLAPNDTWTLDNDVITKALLSNEQTIDTVNTCTYAYPEHDKIERKNTPFTTTIHEAYSSLSYQYTIRETHVDIDITCNVTVVYDTKNEQRLTEIKQHPMGTTTLHILKQEPQSQEIHQLTYTPYPHHSYTKEP